MLHHVKQRSRGSPQCLLGVAPDFSPLAKKMVFWSSGEGGGSGPPFLTPNPEPSTTLLPFPSLPHTPFLKDVPQASGSSWQYLWPWRLHGGVSTWSPRTGNAPTQHR